MKDLIYVAYGGWAREIGMEISYEGLWYCVCAISPALSQDRKGPVFTVEPPNRVEFSNSTGAVVTCTAEGNPPPTVRWVHALDGSPISDVPGLRHVRIDGSLVFPPFRAEDLRPDVHSADYRCVAGNSAGSIGSRDVRVKGVVNQQYVIEVYDEFVPPGSTAVLRCHIPGFIEDFVTVTSWREEITGKVIQPSTSIGGRYLTFPWGTLYIRNVDSSFSHKSYKCQTRNRLTGEVADSSTAGRLIVSESRSNSRPRMADAKMQVYSQRGDTVAIPCVAHGFPLPSYRWFVQENGQLRPVQTTHRMSQLEGTLVIQQATVSDSGHYVCLANNSLGEERAHTRLLVTGFFYTPYKSSVTYFQTKWWHYVLLRYDFPLPSYRWFVQENGQLRPVQTTHRMSQLEGTLVIQQATVSDSGHYVCLANNSLGEERAHTRLLVTAPLSTSMSPVVQKIHVGRPWVINCSVSGHPIHGVHWRKDMDVLSLDGRVSQVSRDVVRIDPVQREDRGMYQCVAYNDQDTSQSAVELSLGDDVPELQETFEEQTIQPGPSLSLKCVASGNPLPQIVWRLDDAPIPENHRTRFGDYVTKDGFVVSFVNVSNVKTEDGGDYRCVANNGVGEVSHEARINVLGPPVVVRRTRNVTVVAGDVLVLRCPVAGYPLENIHWERAGVRLPYNHRQKAHDNGTLEVHHVERATDQGSYVCVATNRIGQTAQSTVVVRIQVKPVIEAFTFPKSLMEGQRSSVLCTVSSGDMPFKIRWFKDGRPIPENIGVRSNEVADYSSTLLFESLALHHRGNYTCVAENDAGTVSHTATMVIHVPPRWVIEPSDVFVVKGRSITVDCQTEGFPQPRVRWTKAEGDGPRDFKSIVSSPHLQVFENGSLSITDATESDAGYYLCQASNGIGQGLSKVVRLKVYIAAHFMSKFTAEMVRKNHKSRLKCEAIGDKPISITWLKDKVELKPHADQRYEFIETASSAGTVSEIVIRQADRRDSALFSCIATNAYGRDDTNIQLIVQEPPDGVQDVRVVESSSRSVKLSWSPPQYNGNSPVTHYTVQFKDEGGKWHNRMNNITVTGPESAGIVMGLKPAKIYLFRVLAENRIGKSEPSKPIEAITQEEAPGAAPVKVRAHPTSSQSIKVSWKPPTTELQHGVLKGYYVGYKVMGTPESFVYKTLEIGESFKEECHVTSLRRNTKYSVVVQAFNSKGAGPPSDEVVVETLENDPPLTPPLTIMDRTSTSLHLAWDSNYDKGNPVSGYFLHHKPEQGEWQESHMAGDQSSYLFPNLECGSKYHFFLIAYNKAGKGEASEILVAKTEGGAPMAPDKQSLLSTNMTSASLNLNSFNDGGCPIFNFRVQFRQQQDIEWTKLHDGPPSNRRVDIVGLSPGAWYQVHVSASNRAGTTDAEYTFSTLNTLDAVTPKTVVNKVTAPFYLDMTIILPVVVSGVVIVIVLIVVCFVVRKKQSSEHYGTGPYEGRKGSCPDGMRLSDMEKNKKHSTSGYYPQPYATTHLSGQRGRSEDGTDSGYHQLQEEPLYATVKRTPRPPRSDGHIYHCPGLMLDTDQRNGQTSNKDATGMRVKLTTDDATVDRRAPGEDDDALMQRIQKYLDAAEKAGIPTTT
ncbi:hypothetical protein JTE90_013867 [Oedothorax gibbosus]|uniref:Down syndrome cell adhesion molecule-like protein Dscam2 n=1 Tax=Oedothorax gibbosus TaxID=931172 RepID=A0AAV6V8X7_9ARAC|nr:hypothetical protein JTE90_013867 [Oedothorax gibbosus]